MNDLTYPIDKEFSDKGYKRLGWQNFWKETPVEVTGCKTLGHLKESESHSNRGSDSTYFCNTCKYFYKLDSSD